MPPTKKRKTAKDSISAFEEALKISEAVRNPVSLEKATEVLTKIDGFRPAKVLLASKLPKDILDIDSESCSEEELKKLPSDQKKALEELQAVNYQKCCRGGGVGKHAFSSHILSVCRPVMKAHPKPKTLSQISSVLENMLTYTQVMIDDWNDWDDFGIWVETELVKIPLFAEITDPAFLIIRGLNGCVAPAGITNTLNGLPVGGNPMDGNLSVAPFFPICRPPVIVKGCPVSQAPIPDLYQFGNRKDAGIVRAALIAWASEAGEDIDITRFVTTGGGIEFA